LQVVIDLRQLDVVQLKAMAYDFIGQMERVQQQLQIVNGEIARRTSGPAADLRPPSPETEVESHGVAD
jgi:hypothetical protein